MKAGVCKQHLILFDCKSEYSNFWRYKKTGRIVGGPDSAVYIKFGAAAGIEMVKALAVFARHRS